MSQISYHLLVAIAFTNMQAFVLGVAGTGGVDTSAISDSSHEQATGRPIPPGGGVEMAALWLRLRRAVLGHSSSSQNRQGSLEDDRAEGGGAGGGGGASGTFELEGVAHVDLSCLGAGLFEARDPKGSGCVDPAVFREVMLSEGLGKPTGGLVDSVAFCACTRRKFGAADAPRYSQYYFYLSPSPLSTLGSRRNIVS